jgi:UDP-glucose 4-epimerase
MDAAVLVTGGSGFVGTWVLRELLARDARVIVLDAHRAPERWQRVLGPCATRVTWADAALDDRDAVRSVIERNSISHIIHLAALLTPACQADPFVGCRVNVLGSTAVFDAARQAGCVRGISYASSYAVYGAESAIPDASASVAPMFYGAFKQAVDLIADQYWRHCGLPSVAVRPHVVYGPERDQGLTAGPSLACRAAALGQRYAIGYTGVVGYDYVEDVARAFVRAAFECPNSALVVDLPSEPATPFDIVRHIEAVLPEARGTIAVDGPAVPPNVPPFPRPMTALFPDWHATPLAEGVRRTIEFYRQRSGSACR